MLTIVAAPRWRKVHYRQRSSRRLELQIRARAHCFWWYPVKHVGWRRAGMQVYGAGDGVYADEECTGIFGMVGGECGGGANVDF
jgi:hypothetical protein